MKSYFGSSLRKLGLSTHSSTWLKLFLCTKTGLTCLFFLWQTQNWNVSVNMTKAIMDVVWNYIMDVVWNYMNINLSKLNMLHMFPLVALSKVHKVNIMYIFSTNEVKHNHHIQHSDSARSSTHSPRPSLQQLSAAACCGALGMCCPSYYLFI